MNETTTIVFLDTETLGLDPDAPIWEIGAIRADFSSDGSFLTEHYSALVRHKVDGAFLHSLPQSFRIDYATRYERQDAVSVDDASLALQHLFRPGANGKRPSVAGAVISFDTERLIRQGFAPASPNLWWHYHIIDVEPLVAGLLALRGDLPAGPPWNSNELSRAIGVNPEKFHTHQALEDAHWALELYRKVMYGVHEIR